MAESVEGQFSVTLDKTEWGRGGRGVGLVVERSPWPVCPVVRRGGRNIENFPN